MQNVPKRPGIGGAIETIRTLRGLSVEELSKKSSVNIEIVELFTGQQELLPEHSHRIAKALDVPISFIYLLAEDNGGELIAPLQEAVITSLIKAAVDKR